MRAITHHDSPLRVAKHLQGGCDGARLALALHAQVGTCDGSEVGSQSESAQQRLRKSKRLRCCYRQAVSLCEFAERDLDAWCDDGLSQRSLDVASPIAVEARRHDCRFRRVLGELSKRVGERGPDEAR